MICQGQCAKETDKKTIMMAINRFYLNENVLSQRDGLCIFISHQKRDSATARKIADYFLTSGIDVYFDEYDIKIDRTIPNSVVNAIKSGIKNSTHMLCLLSENALDSNWIPWEVGYAYDRTIIVGLTIKEIAKSKLPEYLQIIQILRGSTSLNKFISTMLKRDESTLITERKLFSAIQPQHPLDFVLDWSL